MAAHKFVVMLMVAFELFFWNFVVIHCHALSTEKTKENKNSVILDLLGVAQAALYSAKNYAEIEISPDDESIYPMDCADILQRNISSTSGVHKIWPRSRVVKDSVDVYCDMDDDGGAWTIIQRRGDFDSPEDYFYRDWESYKNGFGDIQKDFWLGNDIIFALTNERANSVKFNLADWDGNLTYATYDDFWIDDEAHMYMMHVTGYRGTAGDSFSNTNGIPFTTKDKDNDSHKDNCAVLFKGAWWYTACHSSNLNGFYLKGAHASFADGVVWNKFRGYNYSLKDTTIKIRPKNFIAKTPEKTTEEFNNEKSEITPQ